jgi:eukaryotic-like serine/threonine-protein kinase
MNRDEMTRALASLPHSDRGKVVARGLVEQGKLTRFQAERLLTGQITGFLLGQYKILEELGRGGMGRVYKAVHKSMGRVVALKILSPEVADSPKARECFEREVHAAARLNHPNLVSAYDANHASGRTFLVMEYIDGPSLSNFVKERGPLPVAEAVNFIRQIAGGLEYAHRQGLIHRDIKPSNLLLRKTDQGLQVKLLDFGLVLTTGEGIAPSMRDSGNGTMMGTPDFVSPEQARSPKTVDERSDLYSLGCTFYFLLTGQVPYPGGLPLEKILKHSTDPVPNVQALRNDVPDVLAAMITRLMAKKPSDRYPDAAALIVELDAIRNAGTPGLTHDSESEIPTLRMPARSRAADPWSTLEDDDNPARATQSNLHASTGEIAIPKRTNRRRHSGWIAGALMVAITVGVLVGVAFTVKYLVSRAV